MVYTQCAGRLKLFSCLCPTLRGKCNIKLGLKGGLQSIFLQPYRSNHIQGTESDGPLHLKTMHLGALEYPDCIARPCSKNKKQD